jgi:hypothetical protein
VAVLSEDLVLGEEHSLDTSHELYVSSSSRYRIETTYDTSLSVKVRENLLLKGGLVEVTGTDGDTEGNGLLLGLTGNILPNGDGRVDTSALEEEGSDSSSGSLGGDEDDVDVLGGDNVGLKMSAVTTTTMSKKDLRPPCRQRRNRGQSRGSCPW